MIIPSAVNPQLCVGLYDPFDPPVKHFVRTYTVQAITVNFNSQSSQGNHTGQVEFGVIRVK